MEKGAPEKRLPPLIQVQLVPDIRRLQRTLGDLIKLTAQAGAHELFPLLDNAKALQEILSRFKPQVEAAGHFCERALTPERNYKKEAEEADGQAV